MRELWLLPTSALGGPFKMDPKNPLNPTPRVTLKPGVEELQDCKVYRSFKGRGCLNPPKLNPQEVHRVREYRSCSSLVLSLTLVYSYDKLTVRY